MEVLVLVNRQNTLSELYIPGELVQEPNTKIWLKKVVYEAFCKMNTGIQQEGHSSLVLVSGYRSYVHQQEVFNRKINNLIKEGLTKEEALKKAATIVAVPGTSEHQTGLAIDVTNLCLAKEQDPLIEGFEETDHGKWLSLNSHQYGFILRYPKEKVSITHITYEPWHYRYIGIEHAKAVKELGICLEEYIYYLNKDMN
ncbi:MAG TPA: M15 family metallopeptidase [Epulopiscium sp.]|nr:M15 family metallopeptidase [Candidatus Epulonipiscium sp.]